MSSAASPQPSAPAAADRRTYWCHSCHTSVIIPTSTLICPRCSGDFLELFGTVPVFPFGGPFGRRRLEFGSPTIRIFELNRGPSPAPPSSVDAVPTVEISEPSIACPICKEDLPVGSSARRLACSHCYHSECIVRWLSIRNSCPVCRSSLPAAPGDLSAGRQLSVFGRFDGDYEDNSEDDYYDEDDDDLIRIEGVLGQLTRQRRNRNAGGVEVSPTQLAQVGVVSAATSGETVSSEWRMEIDGRGRGGRFYDDEGDSMASNRRGEFFD